MFENFDDDIVDFLCELERGDLVDINQVLGQDMRAYEQEAGFSKGYGSYGRKRGRPDK